jgi:succinate-semialdehyde dehydrogenase/glutarate-semialdehyde dehydrogenase
MSTLTSRNPYTNEINATFETLSDAELVSKIEQAERSYHDRKQTSWSERRSLFLRLADILERDIEHHAKLETIEMGRLYGIAVSGMKGTVNLIRRFANNAEHILAQEPFSPLDKGRPERSTLGVGLEVVNSEWLTWHIQYDPIGVIYGIAPWNFPYNQLLRAAVPNILAGNTQVYKHASNVPLCAQAIEQLFIEAWFPEWVYTNLFISSSQSELVISHKAIKGINLTGGERAGSVVWALAGKYLKPSVLELGGNDAFVVLDHKDTDAMVALAISCRISNGGQRCNASKRFVVLEHYYDSFVEKMWAYMTHLIVGDPMDSDTQISSLALPSLLEEIHSQVTESIAQGARLVTGGEIIDKERNIYAPTVLADVTPDMRCYQEEIFWPVASIIKAKDVADAIAIANNNDLWLSAVVCGDDVDECRRVAVQLEWGMIFINQPAGSKASLPFGGVKKSGYGKENWPDGLKAFTNKKAVIY